MTEPTPPRYSPADALAAPRYTGIRTFGRCPYVTDMDGVDVAIAGVPFDTATSFRAGARFGPEAIRANSLLLRPFHPEHRIDVFARQAVVDQGDVAIVPGNAERSLELLAGHVQTVAGAGVTPIVLGGDHLITLGELRGHAAVHGPLGLVLLDAHADVWSQYYGEEYFHGTVFRRAAEEGILDPQRSLLAGMRGPLYSADDLEMAEQLGFAVIRGEELSDMSPAEYARRVRDRVGDGAAFLSFDIDVIDPAFAPGTGTPEVMGLLPRHALHLVRSLAGTKFVGFDLVEVSPPYDGPGQVTALLAANLVYDFVALAAIAHDATS
jgi:agmatinase